jgi:hypothetical protein
LIKNGIKKTACQPFKQDANGSYAWLGIAKGNGLVALGMTDDDVVVMKRLCGTNNHRNYFLYDNGKQKEIRIPGGNTPVIEFVSGSGFGGYFYNPTAQQYSGFTSTGKHLKVTVYPQPVVA